MAQSNPLVVDLIENGGGDELNIGENNEMVLAIDGLETKVTNEDGIEIDFFLLGAQMISAVLFYSWTIPYVIFINSLTSNNSYLTIGLLEVGITFITILQFFQMKLMKYYLTKVDTVFIAPKFGLYLSSFSGILSSVLMIIWFKFENDGLKYVTSTLLLLFAILYLFGLLVVFGADNVMSKMSWKKKLRHTDDSANGEFIAISLWQVASYGSGLIIGGLLIFSSHLFLAVYLGILSLLSLLASYLLNSNFKKSNPSFANKFFEESKKNENRSPYKIEYERLLTALRSFPTQPNKKIGIVYMLNQIRMGSYELAPFFLMSYLIKEELNELVMVILGLFFYSFFRILIALWCLAKKSSPFSIICIELSSMFFFFLSFTSPDSPFPYKNIIDHSYWFLYEENGAPIVYNITCMSNPVDQFKNPLSVYKHLLHTKRSAIYFLIGAILALMAMHESDCDGMLKNHKEGTSEEEKESLFDLQKLGQIFLRTLFCIGLIIFHTRETLGYLVVLSWPIIAIKCGLYWAHFQQFPYTKPAI